MKQIVRMMLLAGLLTGCDKQKENTAETATKPLTIKTERAAPRTFERRITVQGTLQAKHFAIVSAQVAGRITALPVDVGDRVEAGKTVLFQIDPVTLKNALTAAEQQEAVAQAAVEVARIAEEKATRDSARFKRLHDELRVTDNEFELYQTKSRQAIAQLALAQAQLGQATASVAIAKKNFADSTGIAPLTGVITARAHEPGELVTPGTRIVTLEDPRVIEAIAYLPAHYYSDIVEGKTQARAFLAGRDAGFFTITRRNPSINPLLRTFEIRGILQSDQAVSGAMVDITVVFATQKGIGVPTAAIVLRNNASCVFTVAGQQARLRKVKTGLENSGWTEITEGLQANEAVAIEGQSQLEEGMHVSVR